MLNVTSDFGGRGKRENDKYNKFILSQMLVINKGFKSMIC